MKRNKKLIIATTAAAAAVMLAAGVTLAVMATDTTTSWTINTPELKLRAKAANVEVWTASFVDSEGNENYVKSDLLLGENKIGFTHSGSVTYTDNAVTIDGILPGDKVEFDIEVTSISTVAFDYRAELYVDATNGQALKNQLDYSFSGMGHLRLDDSVNTNNSDKLSPAVLSDYTEWKTISARQEAVESVHVTISLPYAADKGQGESLTLSYVVGAIQHAQEQSDVAELTYGDGTTKKFNTLGEAVADAQVNGVTEVKILDDATRPEDTITVSNYMKFTGTADKPRIMGARFIVNKGAAVEFENVSFAGDSYVDISDGNLTMTGCDVNVNAVKYFDTYTRTFLKDSAFVVSGSSLTPARLTLTDNTFKSSAGAAVNMRSMLRETVITGNHFGTAESVYDGDAVLSLFGAESDKTVSVENNEMFGKLAMSFNGATNRFNVVSSNNTLVSSGDKFVGGNAPAAFMDSGSKINSQNLECKNLDSASLLFGAVDVTFDKEVTNRYLIAEGKVTLSSDMQVSDFYLNFTATSILATNVIGLYRDGVLYAYLNSTNGGSFEVVPVEG